jgi:molybdate transport system regulatory protein
MSDQLTAGSDAGASAVLARRLRVGQRIWLHRDGHAVLGMGTCELLSRVDSTGSLHRAAADMGMAYSKAWLSVRRAEANLGVALLERHTGGRGGGGSTLSPEGKWLIGAFGALVEDANQMLELLGDRYLCARSPSGDASSRPPASSPVLRAEK